MPARILLADDEEVFLRATAELLRREGYHCDCVRNATDAAAALAAQSYDLLITDINMPGNHELEFLRTTPEGLPVIVVTAYPSVPTAVQSLRLAVVDYLVKPLEVPELLRCIAAAIEKGRVWRTMRNARREAEAWVNSLARLEKSMAGPEYEESASGGPWMLEHYLDQMISYMARMITSLKQTLDAVKHGYAAQTTDVCGLLNCPRLVAYEQGLRHAVRVLEQTKSAFKSKELGALRKELEGLLARSERTSQVSSESGR